MWNNPQSLTLLMTGAAGGIVIGIILTHLFFNSNIKTAEEKARKIKENAEKEAENRRKELALEAKENIFKIKNDLERENNRRRGEIQKGERRISQKIESLERKTDHLDKREREITRKERDASEHMGKIREKEIECQELIEKEMRQLENISGMTKNQAMEILQEKLTNTARMEAAGLIKKIEEEAKEKADQKAHRIISLAIQRCSPDHVAETTVSVVDLPNDDMKGRIIGREGRNIRALEVATGVDLIVDDTPEAVTLSCYDPIKREIAKMALERLITDGRIHPGRIEDIVEKAKREMNARIKEEGEKAAFDVGIEGLHPEEIKLLGRLKYRTSYSQNVLNHSKEVAYLAGIMAAELHLDQKLAKRAGLLHDIGKAVDHQTEGTHTQIGIDLARRYNEPRIVINSIGSHHGDIEPETPIAVLVAAADALSASRPGARREMLETYIKRLEQLENIGDSFKGVEKSFAIQAGREIRVIVKPEKINDNQSMFLAKDIAKKIESEMAYPGEIKVTVLRETRSIEFAR